MGFVDDFVEKNRGTSDYYAEFENFKKKLDEPNKTFNDPNQSHENITRNQSPLVDNRFRNPSENTCNAIINQKHLFSWDIDRKELFSWNDILGNDHERFIEFLNRRFGRRFGIEWLKAPKIEKIDGGKTIKVFAERNFLSLRLNDDKTKVNLKFDNGRTDEFVAKMQNSKLNIYDLNSYTNLEIMRSNVTNANKSFSKQFEISRTGFVREIAHRIFAAEFKEANLTMKEESDQYSPQYLITPTGAKVNRVFIAGALTEKEDVGADAEFWRGRIVDPTGAFFVYAGQYQPEAAQVLAKVTPPEFIAVIGKPTKYTTKEGNIITSIRPESLQIVDAATRDRWVVDTAKHTMARLEKLKGNEPDAVKAKEHYSTNADAYRAMVAQALETVKAK